MTTEQGGNQSIESTTNTFQSFFFSLSNNRKEKTKKKQGKKEKEKKYTRYLFSALKSNLLLLLHLHIVYVCVWSKQQRGIS